MVKEKESPIVVCEVDYDCILKPNKELYIPKIGFKRDLGLNIVDIKDVKAVLFWIEKVRTVA